MASGGEQPDVGDVSRLLGASSYSLRDISTDSFAKDDDADLLDESVLALLDKPYSQLDDRLRLRKQEQYAGFDNSTGSTWIYPTNYPVRQYQFSITKAALFKNTLVVLPTGLGKTFIAAVVMYNIYRWYPTGKVIFMAPTRPLVAQQIDACYHIMGIPREDTAEVTGMQQRNSRAGLWQTKRVFYATPQVVQADLCASNHGFPVDQVRLIVIDEAHKAKGRYAYVEVIRMIAARNKHFRVLALSATPGRTLEDVAEVIQNLLISHIEVRWDNSIDVSPYTFRRSIRTIVIPLGATIRAMREELQQLVDPYVRRLLDANVLSCGNVRSMTRGMLIMEQKRFRENSLHSRHPNHSTVNGDFGVCVSMFHAIDLLVRHGVRALVNFFDDGGEGASEKYFVAKDAQIKEFLNRLRDRYGNRISESSVQDDDEPTLPATGDDDVDFGHPKFRILEQQLTAHFTEHPESKVIVFCEFRDSVAMIHRVLCQRAPQIRAKCIVGQGGTSGIKAVTQKEQIAAMKQFRTGVSNTLIATCVAEEGIDVGEVDLIVCFDITKNPTRFVQRIGRTGRQRIGRVLMLVTEGEEHDTLKRVLASKDRTNQQLAKSKDILRVLYRHSPRLVPGEFDPKCVEMFITITPNDDEPGPSGGKRKPDKPQHDAARPSKRQKQAAVTTPPKGTQDVRRFFQRVGTKLLAADELDASERDIFSIPDQLPSDCSRRAQPDSSSPCVRASTGRTHGTPVDHCIRPGRTEQELAIARRLLPSVRHYEQLQRQQFIHRQQLLKVTSVASIGLQRSFADAHTTLIQQLLKPTQNARSVQASLTVKMDDPLDLPSLGALPESYRSHRLAEEGSLRVRMCSPPPEGPSTPPSPPMEASILNMFDSTLNLSDLARYPDAERQTASALKINQGSTVEAAGMTSVMHSAGRRKHAATVDSPLLRAFDRSMRKRLLDDARPLTTDTPCKEILASKPSTVPDPETPPPAVQGYTKRPKLDLDTPKRKATTDSPLLRAFNRSVHDRSNSDGEKRAPCESTLRRRMVLEYFKLSSLEQIFADDTKEVEGTPMNHPVEEINHIDTCRTILRSESRNDQEKMGTSKNFDLGSAALVFEKSDDDMFAPWSPNENETVTVSRSDPYVSPVHLPPVELKQTPEQQRCRPILIETQQKEQPTSECHGETIEKSPSVFAKHCSVSSKSSLPSKPSEDLNNSFTIGNRLIRARRKHHSRGDVESEDEAEDPSVRPTVHALPTTLQEELNYAEIEDDLFETCKSRPSSFRSDSRANARSQIRQMKPSTSNTIATKNANRQNRRQLARQAARNFLQSQAAVSGSEEEDEHELDEGDELGSFIDPGGSQSPEADTTRVDMRAIYLQSVRSPLVGRGRFAIPHTRTRQEDRPAQHEIDTQDDDDHFLHQRNRSGETVCYQEEDMDSSFITDSVDVDSELSELEEAELLLREKRRAAKRTRSKTAGPEKCKNKRRRIILPILSNSDSD